MEHRRTDDSELDFLLLQLLQPEYSEVFLEFCLDVIRATNRATTEGEALGRFVGRAWTWQRFLASGRDGRLSAAEQMGLLGELSILRNLLIPTLGAGSAVASWTGPLGTPKDFELGAVAVEAKALSGAVGPLVRISSEHQLATDGLDQLFLGVVAVARSDAKGAVTITGYARTVRELLSGAAVDDLEERLRAVGFNWSEDYSDTRWQVGRRQWFLVEPAFPRITPAHFPNGVSAVRYSVSLPACQDFEVSEDLVRAALRNA